MKRLFSILMLLALFISSCGQSVPNTSLSDMLSYVPSDLASGNIVWFSDMQQIKKLAGVEPDAKVGDYFQKDMDHDLYLKRINLMSGITNSPFSGARYQIEWPGRFGFNTYDTTTELWVSNLWILNNSDIVQSRPLFSVMEGEFDKQDIVTKLEGLGYQPEDHTGNDYYTINDDYQADTKDIDWGYHVWNYLNRVMVTERELIAAPADELFFPVLDVRSGDVSTLDGSAAYRRVAEVLADPLGAAIFPPSQLFSDNSQAGWNTLHSYDLIGIGYDSDGETSKTTIILHYPDASAAESDVDELARRMADYVTVYDGAKPTALSEIYEIGRPEAIRFDDDSVLTVALTRQPDKNDIAMFGNWIDLVILEELGFLIIDPA